MNTAGIKIVSNGKPFGTRIIDCATGEDLTLKFMATNISWRDTGLDPHSYGGEATFTCVGVPIETAEGWVIEETTKRITFNRDRIEQDAGEVPS